MVVAPYEVTVDTLMALRINASNIISLFTDISNNSTIPNVISAIVFRYVEEWQQILCFPDGAHCALLAS